MPYPDILRVLIVALLLIYATGVCCSLRHIWQRHRERGAERLEGWGGNAPVSYTHNRGSAA